jgi:hypothetical protein
MPGINRQGGTWRRLPNSQKGTFGRAGLAAQALLCPPKRRIQPERYMPFALKFVENFGNFLKKA